MRYICEIDSPVGLLTAASDGENLTGLWIEGQHFFMAGIEKSVSMSDLEIFDEVKRWLCIYFDGKEPDFVLSLAPDGTPYRRIVWNKLLEIPYGKTTSYGEIASDITNEGPRRTSPRAVGGAVARNPISLIIPCHRVLGADGSLTGYAGGTGIKTRLLEIENKRN